MNAEEEVKCVDAERGTMSHDTSGSPAERDDAPSCPVCGAELSTVERFGAEWWYCDGEAHSYSRQVEA